MADLSGTPVPTAWQNADQPRRFATSHSIELWSEVELQITLRNRVWSIVSNDFDRSVAVKIG